MGGSKEGRMTTERNEDEWSKNRAEGGFGQERKKRLRVMEKESGFVQERKKRLRVLEKESETEVCGCGKGAMKVKDEEWEQEGDMLLC